ncbi:MAG: LapA family protein [Peptococcaceae bacterium]|nr:LapA family protein [Peptococcaceae bacterium]
MHWHLVLAFVFVLAITLFAIQNSQQVTLQFLSWELPPLPLVLVILFSAASGVLVTLLFSIAKQLRLTLQIRNLQSRLSQLEKKPSAQPGSGTEGQDQNCPPGSRT